VSYLVLDKRSVATGVMRITELIPFTLNIITDSSFALLMADHANSKIAPYVTFFACFVALLAFTPVPNVPPVRVLPHLEHFSQSSLQSCPSSRVAKQFKHLQPKFQLCLQDRAWSSVLPHFEHLQLAELHSCLPNKHFKFIIFPSSLPSPTCHSV